MTPVTRAVAVGGGHGLSRSLQALTDVVDEVTAIVTVADDGGSSGRLRRDLGVVPPGDLRMAMAALSADARLEELLQYRFDRGELAGHSLGNLVLVALADLAGGDVVAGLDRLAALVGARGRVLPCTTTPVVLHADAADGRVTGQVEVAGSRRVRRVWLEPVDVAATPAAVAAIATADLVVLGPGSLFTSVIPNLLVPGIAAAVVASTAPVVLVANLREQAGETEGMTLPEHLDALVAHVPDLRVDVVVANEGHDGHDGHARPAAPALAADPAALAAYGVRVVRADLLDGDAGHRPDQLARALRDVTDPSGGPAGDHPRGTGH